MTQTQNPDTHPDADAEPRHPPEGAIVVDRYGRTYRVICPSGQDARVLVRPVDGGHDTGHTTVLWPDQITVVPGRTIVRDSACWG